MPYWSRFPTEEPLSPGLRADVKIDLEEGWHSETVEEFRRQIKYHWHNEGSFLTLEGLSPQLVYGQINWLCNVLTAFYWMPGTRFDGIHLDLLPFGCIWKEWFKYHDNMPDMEFHNFFAHLIRVLPSGPTTVQGIIEAHKRLYIEATSRLEHVESSNYTLKATYRAIIIMMDQYVDPYPSDQYFPTIIYLEEHSKKQTVLLVRTGDDSHLTARVNFKALREGGLCLPLERTDISATSEDVVRVSLTTAVKYITDLQQREHTTFPEPATVSKMEKSTNVWAEGILAEADAKGIDNCFETWLAVRRIKAARMGEIFQKDLPPLYRNERYWR